MTELAQLGLITGVLFISVASPGPNFALVTSTAMATSRRAGLLTGVGFGLASGAWALLAIGGVGVLVAHAPAVRTAAQVAGALYLIWLGLKMIRGARRPLPAHAPGAASGVGALRRAILVSLGNPKAIGFYGSIFSVMVPTGAPLWFHATVVALSMLVSAGWYCSLALLFSHRSARRVYARMKFAAETCMGAFLVGLGGRMLLGR